MYEPLTEEPSHQKYRQIQHAYENHRIRKLIYDLSELIICVFQKVRQTCEYCKQQCRAQQNAEHAPVGVNTGRDTQKQFEQINDEKSELIAGYAGYMTE